MYGKWLYKEIGTEYGACMVEIYRKNYTGGSIEIGALAADSLSIALENLGSITDPIGKSVCSFSIIDTNQVEYDDFFTPDATALKVVVSTRVGGGAYVTRWSGYVTPDFFAENLSYRTPISISARDNIGYLNDVDFDLTATTITVRGLIQSAFARIAEDYPMSLSFVTQKQTAEGILAIDATISTTLLREMSWGEALETILHDLGLQMRWVDNNTIAVLDLSQIPEYYATQVFNFVDASGYREIVPAWRELSQEQNYGVRENFFEGWLREDNITFVKTENIRIPLSMGGVTGLVPMRYYTPNNWGVAGNTFVINPKDYVYFGTYGQMAQPFGERIFFTGVEKDATNIANNYMSYRQDVYASNRPMRITFKAFTSVMATGGIGNNDALLAYDPANRFMDFATGDTLQLGLKVNLLLHVGTRTYILGQNWEEINGAETNSLYFVLPKIGQVDGSSVTPNEEEITIDVNTIPNDGVLELRIYGFTIHNKTNLQEDAGSATYDWLRMVSYINEVKYTYNIDNPDTGRYSQVEVNKQHNIKDTQSYTFGQIPVEGGAVNAFAGGLFKADGNELIGFQRNANATNYNLLELVGRELIHFNKKNYNRLSGTIKNLSKEPLMFNRLFVREGKRYAPYNYSLNVISNEMNITSMQEVEPYTTANFSEVHSEVSTGGSTVSSGNNQILQYSAEVGNAKRLYELQTISENEKPDAYVLVDGAGYPEARKLKLTDIAGLDEKALEQYLVQYKYLQEADLTPIIQDFEKLEEAVNPLFGYFDANGNANNALKLGGHYADYFATADALNTHIKAFNTYKTTTDERLDELEALWYMDKEGNVHTTHNIVVEKGGAFGKGSGGGGDVPSGGGIDETQLWNILGQSGTQTIHSSHIPDLSGKYLPLSGGELNGSIASTAFIFRDITTGNRGAIIQNINDNTWRLQNYWTGGDYTIIHSGNIGSYNAGSATKLANKRTLWGREFDGTSNIEGHLYLGYNRDTEAIIYGVNNKTLVYSHKDWTLFSTPTIKTFFDGSEFWLRGGNVYIGDGTANSTHLTVDGHIQHSSGVKYLSMAVSGSYRYVNVGDYANTSYTTITNINANTWTRWIDGSGTEIMRVDHTGNSYRLDVKGSLNATTVYQNGTTLDTLLSNYLLKSGGAITRSDRSLLLLKNTNAEGQSTLWLGGDFETFDKGGFIAYGGKTGDVSIANFKAYNNNFNGLSAIRITSDNKVQVGDVNFKEGQVYDIIHSGSIGSQSVNYANSANSANYSYGLGIENAANVSSELQYMQFSSQNEAGDLPTNGWWHIIKMGHGNADTYFNRTLAFDFWSNDIYTRNRQDGIASDWEVLAFLSSNVASATKLQNARTIWGQYFDGTGDVNGYMYVAGPAYFNNYSATGNNPGASIIINKGTDYFSIGPSSANVSNMAFGLCNSNWNWTSEQMVITNTGNVLIGTTSDNGCKFQVNGTTPSYFYNSSTRYSLVVDSGLASKIIAFGGWDNNEKAQVGYTNDIGFSIFNYQSYRNNNAGKKITAVGITDTGIFYVANSGNPGPDVATLKVETSLVTVMGNLTVTGGGAFGSDIRYKDITSYRQLDLETIVNAPLFSFKWTDREDKVEHLGTSAQYWLGTQFKDAVNTTNKDFFHLDYGALAVGIGISVAREVKGVKTEVELLKDEVRQLRKKLKEYETYGTIRI